MSGNAPVPPPPPHSEPAQQPPVFQPRSQPPAAPVPGPDQQATAYQPAQPPQPAYGQGQPTAYQQQPAYGQDPTAAYQQQPAAQPVYQQPAYQAPPPAFAPGSGQQAAYQAQQPAPQPAYQAQPSAYQAPQQAYQPAYAEQPPVPSAPGAGPGGPRRGGKRLSPGWIAFIAVDVILVGIVIAFAISLAGGDKAPDAAAGPDTAVEAPAQDPAAPSADAPPGPVEIEGESVTSPSRNITCTIGEDGVLCGIAELATQPAPVEGCAGATGYVVTLTEDGVQIPCVASAALPTKAGDDVPVLEYDQTKTVESFSCTSSTSGMRCTDSETGKGFNVAKAGLSSF
jgi:hypothetical protein